MNEHKEIQALLPFFVTGALSEDEHARVTSHLYTCAQCREELEFWRIISSEIQTSSKIVKMPEMKVNLPGKREKRRLWKAWYVLRSQISLIRTEIWFSSALVNLMGLIVALLVENVNAIYFLAPFLSAAGVAHVYGMQNDPAVELTLATPISAQQILLARLALVFGYNILLTFSAGFLTTVISGQSIQLSWVVLLEWIAPMAFLSSLALFCSLIWGSTNAVAAAYALWIVKGIITSIDGNGSLLVYKLPLSDLIHILEEPELLFLLSLIFVAIALWITGKERNRLLRGKL